MQVGGQVKPRSDFDVVKQFHSLTVANRARDQFEERGNFVTRTGIKPTCSEAVVRATGNRAVSSDAETEEPCDGVSVVVRDSRSSEETPTFGWIAGIDVQELIEVPISRPGTVCSGNRNIRQYDTGILIQSCIISAAPGCGKELMTGFVEKIGGNAIFTRHRAAIFKQFIKAASADSGLQNMETVDTVALNSAGTPTGANVGLYDINATSILTSGNGFDAGNYNVMFNTLTDGFEVTPAPLTIDVGTQYKPLGTFLALDQTSGFTVTGLKNMDTVTSVTLNSLGTSSAAPVGVYSIDASLPFTGVFDPNNYNITFNSGSLIVGTFGTGNLI